MRTEKEILAALVGTITKENERIVKVEVESLHYLEDPEATSTECGWRNLDIAKLQIHCWPKVILGSLHSHPEFEGPALSKADIETAEANGETIFGVFTYWTPPGSRRRRTSLDWYYGARALKV